MKKSIIRVSAFFMGFVMGMGLAKLTKAQSAEEQQQGILYKITGNDLTETSYLFGTIHAICPDKIVGIDTLKALVNQSDKLFLELDLTDPKVLTTVQAGSFLPDGKTVADYLSEEDEKALDNFFTENMGVGLAQLGKMKPFMLMSLAMLSPKSMGCQPQAYDMLLAMTAKQNEVPILGLESAEEQLGVIDAIPLNDQANMLIELISTPEKIKNDYAKLLDAYRTQNTQHLYEVALELSPEMKLFEDEFLINRNENWIPVIEEHLGENACFIAVGAGHLGGEKGVLNLLKAKGYRLEPIKL